MQLAEAARHDYHAARQLAWASQRIISDLSLEYPADFQSPASTATTKEQWRASGERDAGIWDDWYRNTWMTKDAEIKDTFQRLGLNDSLGLTLPAGKQTKLVDDLPGLLRAMADYRPDNFITQIEALREWTSDDVPQESR
jgi:hypothetical protein